MYTLKSYFVPNPRNIDENDKKSDMVQKILKIYTTKYSKYT